jgi:hypothetical protein
MNFHLPSCGTVAAECQLSARNGRVRSTDCGHANRANLYLTRSRRVCGLGLPLCYAKRKAWEETR